MAKYPVFILGCPVRIEGELARVYFELHSVFATFDLNELLRLAELYRDARLRVTSNGRGRLYVRVRWSEDATVREESVARVLECIRGGVGDLACAEVRLVDGNSLNLVPRNRSVSARGRFRGRITAWRATAYRKWRAHSSNSRTRVQRGPGG